SEKAHEVVVEKVLCVLPLFEIGVHVRDTKGASDFKCALFTEQLCKGTHRHAERDRVNFRVRKTAAQILSAHVLVYVFRMIGEMHVAHVSDDGEALGRFETSEQFADVLGDDDWVRITGDDAHWDGAAPVVDSQQRLKATDLWNRRSCAA